MHDCPHCRQQLNTFAFYCPRCQRAVGELRVEGVMLAVWWLDAGGAPAKKWGVKTLKSGADDLNLEQVSPARPSVREGETLIKFTTRTTAGAQRQIERRAAEVFAEVSRANIQEWEL